MRTRSGARLLLLDESDRVLLVRVEDDAIVNPADDVPFSFWVTIGGGVEAGETFETAARREAFEETGVRELVLGPVIWDRRVTLYFRNEPVDVLERYFAARVSSFAASMRFLTPEEQRVVREQRWWSAEELCEAAGREAFVPRELPDLLARAVEALRDGNDDESTDAGSDVATGGQH